MIVREHALRELGAACAQDASGGRLEQRGQGVRVVRVATGIEEHVAHGRQCWPLWLLCPTRGIHAGPLSAGQSTGGVRRAGRRGCRSTAEKPDRKLPARRLRQSARPPGNNGPPQWPRSAVD